MNKHVIGNTYEERYAYQLEQWVAGNPIHNDIDGNCLPDFSCCNKRMHTDIEKRKAYLEHYKKTGEWEMGLLQESLGKAMLTTGKETNIYVAGCENRDDSEDAELKPEQKN